MLVSVNYSKSYDLSNIPPDQIDYILKMFLEMPLARGVRIQSQGTNIMVVYPKSESIKNQIKDSLSHDFYYDDKRGTIREIVISFMQCISLSHKHPNVSISQLFAGTKQISGAYIIDNPVLMDELLLAMHFFGFQNPSYEGTVRSSSSQGTNIYYLVNLGNVDPYTAAKMEFPGQFIEEMLQ